MRQITLSVPLEVKPESCSSLSALIDALKQREDKGVNPAAANFDRIIRLIPSLHFMSMSVFPAANLSTGRHTASMYEQFAWRLRKRACPIDSCRSTCSRQMGRQRST
jgi:hypothetical protein